MERIKLNNDKNNNNGDSEGDNNLCIISNI